MSTTVSVPSLADMICQLHARLTAGTIMTCRVFVPFHSDLASNDEVCARLGVIDAELDKVLEALEVLQGCGIISFERTIVRDVIPGKKVYPAEEQWEIRVT